MPITMILNTVAMVLGFSDDALQPARLDTGADTGGTPTWWPSEIPWTWSAAPWLAAAAVLSVGAMVVLWIRHRRRALHDPAGAAFHRLCEGLGLERDERLAVERRARDLGVAPVGVLIAEGVGEP